MKTLGIIAAVLGVTGLLGWIVVQTLSTNNEDSAYNMHPDNFEKPRQENTISFEEKSKADDDTLDLRDEPDKLIS